MRLDRTAPRWTRPAWGLFLLTKLINHYRFNCLLTARSSDGFSFGSGGRTAPKRTNVTRFHRWKAVEAPKWSEDSRTQATQECGFSIRKIQQFMLILLYKLYPNNYQFLLMRIGIDARMYGNEECTGIGTYIQRMTDELFKIDRENEYVIFLRGNGFDKFQIPNNRVKKVRVAPRWYTYDEQIKLPFIFAKEKLDLIHYPHFNSPILYPKKSICTIHDITPFYFPGHKMGSKWRRYAHKLVFGSTIAKAKQIIAVSESTKQGILDKFKVDPNKIKITYEGVDERFKKITNNGIINEIKRKFGITKPYIFYVGVWRNHKNIESLIKAFNLLKRKHQINHQLVLGGREDLHYTNIREEIEKSPFKKDILTTGYIADDELPVLYSGAETFVIPSFIEGFGLIAIEAQKCECPVISSNTSSLPEVLAKSALFFAPVNIEEMATRIKEILDDPKLRETLIVNGKKNADRFSWQKCAEQTLQIYKSA